MFWVDIGAMDYIGALVSERLGIRSVEEWKKERIDVIKNLDSVKPISQNEIFVLSVSSWAMFLLDKPSYKADLLFSYLIEKQGKQSLIVLPTYYRESLSTTNIYEVLSRNFQIDCNQFFEEYIDWYNYQIMQVQESE